MIHLIGLLCMAIGLTFAVVGMVVITLVDAFSQTDHDDKKLPEIRITDEWVLGEGYLFQPFIYKPKDIKKEK